MIYYLFLNHDLIDSLFY